MAHTPAALCSSSPITSTASCFLHLWSSKHFKIGGLASSQFSVRAPRYMRLGHHQRKLTLRYDPLFTCRNESHSAPKLRNSDDISGRGGLDGEERMGAEGIRRRPHHLRKFTAWEVATKAAARPPQATSMTGEVGELNKMNGSRPDPYVILNLGSFIRRVPFQRFAVWICVAITMYQLRDFVGIIMGTVVLSVVGNTLVGWAEEYFPGRRRLLVATMYLVIIAALVGIGIIYIPRLTQEGAKVIARIQKMKSVADKKTILSGC
jgi:hypothetical protein